MPEPAVNIAELMAKQGVKTEEGDSVEVPSINTEVKPEVAEAPTAEIAATPAPQQAEPPKEEPSPEPVAVTPPEREERPAEVSWQDAIKKQPEVEVLKALGLDEKMINFLGRWKGGEDLKEYFEAVSVDYSQMTDEQIMRRYLTKEYGKFSGEDFEELYRMKVTEQYKLDGDVFSEQEVRRGKLLLSVDADRHRGELIKRQQELLLSKPPEPQASPAEALEQAAAVKREKDILDYRSAVQGNSFTKELLSSKLLKIGDGEKAFNLEVSKPDEVINILFDPVKWSKTLWNEDGSPNIRKQLILGAIAQDDTAFFANLSKHYETLGAKKIAEQLENPSPPPGAPSKGEPEITDPIAHFAKFGQITSG